MIIRSNVQKFESLCVSYPILRNIDGFTPGMQTIMLDIAMHLNQSLNVKDFDDEQTVVDKMFEHGKKVRFFEYHCHYRFEFEKEILKKKIKLF